MSLSEAVYLRLPIPLKQAAMNYYGRRLVHQRYASTALDEHEWGVVAVTGKRWLELQAMQDRAVSRLFQRAQRLSPFWAERLAGLRVENAAELEQAPTLAKQEMRAAGRRVVCSDIGSKE